MRRYLWGFWWMAVIWVGLTSPVCAYERTTVTGAPNLPLYWAIYNVNYKINTSGFTDVPAEELSAEIQKGFSAWNEVSCSCFAFTYGGNSSLTAAVIGKDSGSSENVVFFEGTNWSKASNILALTTTYYNTETGQLYAFEMAFNSQHFKYAILQDTPNDPQGVFDILNTTTHEAGHALGLDHSADAVATMAFSSPTNETSKRSLDNDDRQGLCAIYPKEKTCTGCACSAQSVGASDALLWVWAALCFVGIFLLRRRKRSPSSL
ncbi:MAG: matrixin family metalloprotease [Myxococcales bacterium]|nr:matrixin family metalloprotease [Myxococcales bacterium]